MNNLLTSIKKYWYLFVGAAVLLWLALRNNNASSQVVNRIIPTTVDAGGADETRIALAQIASEYNLGQSRLTAEAALADKQIAAETNRLEYQNKALEIQGGLSNRALELQGQYNLSALDLQGKLQERLATLDANRDVYDAQLQAQAIQNQLRSQGNQNLLNNLFGLGSGILQGLLNQNRQQSQQPRQSGGSSGGLAPIPSGSPSQPVRRTSTNFTALTDFLNRYYNRLSNQPVSYGSFLYPNGTTGPLDNLDYWNQIYSPFPDFQFWNPYDPYDLEPQGTVTSSYQLNSVDWWNQLGFGSENEFWDWFDWGY